MKKYLLSAVIILAFVFYSYKERTIEKETIEKIVAPPPKIATAQFSDGIYTGDVTDAIYGNVEVQVTISQGKLTEVEFLKYPNHHQYSKDINPEALPTLAKEAIEKQSAKVDIYSGATQTSKAFRLSLQTALQKAKL